MVQKGDGPSLYMVLPCTLALRTALSSYDELLKYEHFSINNEAQKDNEKGFDDESELLVESDGNA